MPLYNQAYLDEQARNAAYDASMLASQNAPGGGSGSYEAINWDRPSSYVDDIISGFTGAPTGAGGGNMADFFAGAPVYRVSKKMISLQNGF